MNALSCTSVTKRDVNVDMRQLFRGPQRVTPQYFVNFQFFLIKKGFLEKIVRLLQTKVR